MAHVCIHIAKVLKNVCAGILLACMYTFHKFAVPAGSRRGH